MATAKTTTLTFRIEPELKEVLRTAANREHRSIANIDIQKAQALASDNKKPTTRKRG